MPRRAVRRSVLEKGGAIDCVSQVLSELVDQLPHGAVGQAEPLSNVFRRLPFEKHSAERFVTAVIRIGWSSEEVSARGVIRDPNSRNCQSINGGEAGSIVDSNGDAVDTKYRETT